jgi:hypothetical protein
MSITPITNPLPGEHVVALSPESAEEAATTWLARPNVFAGRALTAPTLQKRQRWQAGHLALRGQALTSGIVHGLEVGHETVESETNGPRVRLIVGAGLGIAASGEDVELARSVRIDLRRLPVYAEPSAEALDPPPSPPPTAGTAETADVFDTDGAELRARVILQRDLGTLFEERPQAIARVGVLVLQPVEVDRLGAFDPTDPCELSPCGEVGDELAFEDWRIADGVRAVWYAWPGEWRDLPPDGAAWRSRIAWTIFLAERALAPGAVLPWETLGVPIALIGLTDELAPAFIDRASVARYGGRTRNPRLTFTGTAIRADWRRPALWQAQIEQLAEAIASAADLNPAKLRNDFALLPPAGLLPSTAIDLSVLPFNNATETLASAFFPVSFELDAVPVPLENLDLAIREAAPLAPIDLHAPDRVRVLVPVPQAVYEPRLLLEEVIDPEFQATLDRFLLARSRALGARQGLRRKLSELVRLATGRAVPVPAFTADSAALEPETLEPWGPPPPGGGHRSTLAPGLHQHSFTGATATLPYAAVDKLHAWVFLDPDHPPRVLMLQWRSNASAEHRAYWSAPTDKDLIPLGIDGNASRKRVGELPAAGGWTRLTVPAADVGLDGAAIDGMAFMLFDGRAAYGSAGSVAPDDTEHTWFSDVLPGGAQPPDAGEEPWTFLTPNDLAAPFDPDFGLQVISPANPELGASTDIAQLLADPVLGVLAGGSGVLSDRERSQLDVRGLEGFIAFLNARADRADDLVDYGFVKVQTDTYRIRQLMLGTTNATRLAVSPVLATIAQADTAPASQQRISTFFDELKAAPAPKAKVALIEATGPAARENTGTIGGSETHVTGRSKVAGKAAATKPAGKITTSSATGPFVLLSRQKAVDLSIGTAKVFQGAALAFTPNDVVNANPLVGKASIRTTTIAQRLEQPKAAQAKDYATATRHDSVHALLRLADELRAEDQGVTPGLFANINLYGIEDEPFLVSTDEKEKRFVPLAAFIADRNRLAALLEVPDREGDEAANFSDSADLADNTVALLRQVEGRIKLYRDAARACERVLEAMREDIAAAGRALGAWDEHLAEARHDVAVARALIVEENERLGAINRRRAAVLQKEVRFLAYIRPREVHNLGDAPLRTLNPGLIEAPVPACLAAHADIPAELVEMLAVVREAPVAWFPAAPKLVEKLDRTDLLVRAVQSAKTRSVAFAVKASAVKIAPAASAVRNAIGLVHARSVAAVRETRQLATTIDVAHLATLTWQGARAKAQEVVSLGDLIDGEHGRGEISRKAAEIFDRMSRIAGCLHAEFSAVLPSIRLDWAEALSQFDRTPNLRDLSALARWSEIEFIDRKQMQAYVDWLFDQIDARVRAADALMNDVIRMCLLLAADAPIGRILAGRLPRPVVARPGVRIPLTAFDPSRLRVGMHALIYRGGDLVARAVVEDIGSEISAHVVYTASAEVSLDVQARVHFAEAALVSVTNPATGRAVKTVRVT